MDKPADLTGAENRLNGAAVRGKFADYLGLIAELNKPECGTNWGPDRTIRAEFIRWLILGPLDGLPVDPKGILIKGALIKGELDLSGITVAFPLAFTICHFEKRIELTGAKTKDLCLDGSYLSEGLRSYNLKTHGDVSLGNGFVAKDEVCLVRADIDGRLNCSNGKFETRPSPNKYALNAGGLVVKGHVRLNDGFSAKGEVRLPGAEIGGRLICTNGTFDNPKGYALNAIDLKVDGTVFLNERFHAKGEVRLHGADIGGQLDCTGGTFENPGDDALNAGNLKIKGAVFFNKGFTAKGEVRLYWADIGDRLECTGGTFENADGDALSADGINVRGGVFLKAEVDNGNNGKVLHPFAAKGEVRFNGADIGGRLNCTGGKFENPGAIAFSASGLKVKADVFFRRDPKSSNSVSDESFTAKGEVRLPGAEIGGHLDCTGGTFDNPEGFALRIENAKVAATLSLSKATIKGKLNLSEANVGRLSDDMDSWPEKDKLLLDGFKYTAIVSKDIDVKKRLEWLARQPSEDKSYGFHPQPYEQLFQVLRTMGHERDARDVAIVKQQKLRKKLSWDVRVLSFFLRWTVGYGYRTGLSYRWMAGLFAIGGLVFCLADLKGDMRPSEEEVILHPNYSSIDNKCGAKDWLTLVKWSGDVVCVPPDYPAFNPFIYSADALLPIIDLHQENYWMPQSATLSGKFFEWYLWFHIFVGWVLTTAAVAAFTGVFKK